MAFFKPAHCCLLALLLLCLPLAGFAAQILKVKNETQLLIRLDQAQLKVGEEVSIADPVKGTHGKARVTRVSKTYAVAFLIQGQAVVGDRVFKFELLEPDLATRILTVEDFKQPAPGSAFWQLEMPIEIDQSEGESNPNAEISTISLAATLAYRRSVAGPWNLGIRFGYSLIQEVTTIAEIDRTVKASGLDDLDFILGWSSLSEHSQGLITELGFRLPTEAEINTETEGTSTTSGASSARSAATLSLAFQQPLGQWLIVPGLRWLQPLEPAPVVANEIQLGDLSGQEQLQVSITFEKNQASRRWSYLLSYQQIGEQILTDSSGVETRGEGSSRIDAQARYIWSGSRSDTILGFGLFQPQRDDQSSTLGLSFLIRSRF